MKRYETASPFLLLVIPLFVPMSPLMLLMMFLVIITNFYLMSILFSCLGCLRINVYFKIVYFFVDMFLYFSYLLRKKQLRVKVMLTFGHFDKVIVFVLF